MNDKNTPKGRRNKGMAGDEPLPALEKLLTETEARAAASEEFKHVRYGPFVEARTSLEEAGRSEDAERMQWAAEAFMFYERRNRENGESYFGPLMTVGGEEAPEWTNMESRKVDFYAERAVSASSSIIISRYADIVWEKRKDHKFARLAGDSYVQAAAIYKERGWHSQMVQSLVRATELALILRDRELLHERLRTLQQYLDWLEEIENYEWGLEFVRALVEIPKKWAGRDFLRSAERFALKAATHYRSLGGDALFTEREFLELVRKIRARLGDKGGETEIVRKIAESFQENARAREASHLYNQALQLYKDLADKEKVQLLLLKIRECNVKAEGEFGVISTEVTVSKEEVDKLIGYYTSGSLEDNLRRLSIGFWPNVEAMRETTESLKQEAPLQFMIGRQVFSSDARVVGQISGEEALFHEHIVFQAQLGYQANAGIIAEILRQLGTEQGLNHERLTDFLCSSDVIGSGRRNFLSRGLERYFAGDYVSAIHVLTPQIENILRSILPRTGIADTYVDEYGIMRVLPLERVLRTPEIKSGFGKDLWVYFYTFLVDQDAENVRNDVAHGLIEWERCNETIATIIVHLLLILTVLKIGTPETTA